MTIIKKLISSLELINTNLFALFLLASTTTFAQSSNSPYQVIRLNDGNPIITPDMFVSDPNDGEDINGPSMIRIPSWIPTNERADPTAQYYLYFAHHSDNYVRMAWAADIEGPYTLYNDAEKPKDRGVLNNKKDIIYLDNGITIDENHLASPDVIVDDVNQRIIMYFHSGSSFWVDTTEKSKQVTWVSTSPYGLDFSDNIESVWFGDSYFRVFEYGGEMYALDNSGEFNRALDATKPWDWTVPEAGTHDFTKQLWDSNPVDIFQNAIDNETGLTSAELRVRHTGVRVVGDQLHVFYSGRGDIQERIQLSIIDMTDPDWGNWAPTYPPHEILAPNPGWEDGELDLLISETSDGVDLNQLRDPDFFEDTDGKLYVIYSGSGEGGLGIARLYETPTTNILLTTTADAQVKEGSNTNFGDLSKVRVSTGSGGKRTIYMKFNLSEVTNIDHAVARLYVSNMEAEVDRTFIGGPVTIFEVSDSSWDETSINASNAPSLGNVITTTYISNTGEYYDWNITEYAKTKIGTEFTIAFDIVPSNLDISFEFGSLDGSNPPAQLMLVAESATLSTVWTGDIDSDWTDTRNWSGSVAPGLSPTINISIPSGVTNYPVLTAGQNLTITSGNNLSIVAGASLTVNSTASLTNNGTITNSGSILLKSSDTGTGYLLSDTNIDNITQERYLTSNQRGWRMLSNPLATTTFGALALNSSIDLGSSASGEYNSANNTWSSGADTDNMVTRQGYKVFIRGLASEVTGLTYSVDPPSNVTIKTDGAASNTAPSSITTVAGQYYLVVNPYTAPVSVSSILSQSSGLSSSVSYYNPTLASTDVKVKAGGYEAITVSGTSGSSTDVVLPPMGAIFVQATSAGSINTPKSAIYTGAITSPTDNFAHKTTKIKNATTASLTVNVKSNGVIYDKLQLKFKEVGTSDSNIDFGKLPNTILDFYSITPDSKNMATAELELTAQTIPLGITSTALQNFTFNIEENSIPIDFEVVLEDKMLNTKTVLSIGTDYNFTIDNTTNSQGEERFALTMQASGTLGTGEDLLDSAIKIWPNPASTKFHILNNQTEGETTFEIYTITGQLIDSYKVPSRVTVTTQTNGWSLGVYILKATSNGNQITKKLIIQ